MRKCSQKWKTHIECFAENLQGRSAPCLLVWQRAGIVLQLWQQVYGAIEGRSPQLYS